MRVSNKADYKEMLALLSDQTISSCGNCTHWGYDSVYKCVFDLQLEVSPKWARKFKQSDNLWALHPIRDEELAKYVLWATCREIVTGTNRNEWIN